MAFCAHVALWAINHKSHAEMSLHDQEANTSHILAFLYDCLKLPVCQHEWTYEHSYMLNKLMRKSRLAGRQWSPLQNLSKKTLQNNCWKTLQSMSKQAVMGTTLLQTHEAAQKQKHKAHSTTGNLLVFSVLCARNGSE